MKLEGPILLGTDFSAASDEALRQANDLATGCGTTLIVCHVVPALDPSTSCFRSWPRVTRSVARR